MMEIPQEWKPQPGTPDHAGQILFSGRLFFVAPPLEIGTVVSAFSTVLSGKDPNPLGKRLGISVLVAAAVMFLAWMFLHSFIDAGSLALWMGLAGGIIAPVTFFVSKKPTVCSYIGQQGMARFKLKKDLDETHRGEVFLFQYAAELRTSQTRRYTNGIYNGTSYTYTWTDFNGKNLFVLSGNYSSEQGTPRVGDDFYYARAGEGAWSAFAFERAKAELARNGAVRFNLSYGNYVVVGAGFVDLCFKGQTARCSTQEIARVSIHQGVITLRRTDARSGFFGIGSSGIFTFNYADLGNARLFCVLLDHLVGVDFS